MTGLLLGLALATGAGFLLLNPKEQSGKGSSSLPSWDGPEELASLALLIIEATDGLLPVSYSESNGSLCVVVPTDDPVASAYALVELGAPASIIIADLEHGQVELYAAQGDDGGPPGLFVDQGGDQLQPLASPSDDDQAPA